MIECQGDYWHVNPKMCWKRLTAGQVSNLKRDRKKRSFLREKGVGLLLFWELDIHGCFGVVKRQIDSLLKTKMRVS